MTKLFGRAACAGLATAVFCLAAAPAFSETLFKIVTVKDEIVVGLNDAELAELGGDAGALAKSIASRGSISVWQYAVKKGANGELQQAPLQKVGVLASTSLRVEPYKTPLKVLAQDAIDPGQRPPAEAKNEPQAPAEPVKCVSDDSTFMRDGKKNVFRVSLKNSCPQPQRCKVNVYVVGSTGPIKGSTTLTIPGAAAGQYAQKTWDLKVHDNGGSANMARDCNAI
jgi:hypothetical protein